VKKDQTYFNAGKDGEFRAGLKAGFPVVSVYSSGTVFVLLQSSGF
jgi:hypothetical protein